MLKAIGAALAAPWALLRQSSAAERPAADLETAATDLSHNGRQQRAYAVPDELSNRKAIMLCSREFILAVAPPHPSGPDYIDSLKTSQCARDELCRRLLMPIGTVIVDMCWDIMFGDFDRLAFLVTNPDFPETGEAQKLPRVQAEYYRNPKSGEVSFVRWGLYDADSPLWKCSVCWRHSSPGESADGDGTPACPHCGARQGYGYGPFVVL